MSLKDDVDAAIDARTVMLELKSPADFHRLDEKLLNHMLHITAEQLLMFSQEFARRSHKDHSLPNYPETIGLALLTLNAVGEDAMESDDHEHDADGNCIKPNKEN